MMNWQQIATAPKDKYILLFAEFTIGDPLIFQGCGSSTDDEECWIDTNGYDYPATHWSPLPPPPETVGASKPPKSGKKPGKS
jgi:hypothetical protein